MNDQPSTQCSDSWRSLIDQASLWFEGPLGQQLLAQEQHVLNEELSRCFGSYLIHNGPFAGASVAPQHIKRSVRLGAPCPGWKFIARSRPGRSVSTPPMWWCCSMRWTSAFRRMGCCAKPPAGCAPAGIC
ncbi:SAM-dependent methyltransferase [Pseudomonas sp. BAY1663]|nr:SAM-dependent methyltransferase [Pseudomonas sp. BAY1663]